MRTPPIQRAEGVTGGTAALQNSLPALGIKEMDAIHVEIDLNVVMHLGAHLGVHTRCKGIALAREFQNDFRPERFEYFLETRGWYLEWIRDTWKREENAEYARQVFLDPVGALRRMAPQFKAAEPSLESLFWNSRYEKR